MAKGFPKGHAKKGTRKGSPNRITRITREWISDFLSTPEERKCFESDWKDMEARDRMNARLKLIEFTVPKMAPAPEQGKEADFIEAARAFGEAIRGKL